MDWWRTVSQLAWPAIAVTAGGYAAWRGVAAWRDGEDLEMPATTALLIGLGLSGTYLWPLAQGLYQVKWPAPPPSLPGSP